MSISDKKRKIFTTLSSYTSYMEQPEVKKTDSFSSINNKNDVVPFLLDALRTIAGTEGLKEAIGGLFTKVITSGETKIKNVLKKQVIQHNSGDAIPNSFKNDGVNIPISKIDSKGKYKIDPATDSGKMIYNKSNTADFDSSVYDAIRNPNTAVSIPSMKIDITYNDSTDSLNIKPPSGISDNIGDYLIGFIGGAIIINSNEIATNIMDTIYGTLSKENSKSKNQITEDLKVQKLLENASNNNVTFTLSPTELNEIDTLSNELSKGITTHDMSCGLIVASLPFSGLTNLINTISGSTDSFAVSNAFENTVSESTQNSKEETNENIQTIKDGFFQKLIKIFTNAFMQAAITQPQVRALMIIANSFLNNGQVIIEKASEYMAKNKVYIMCLVKEIISMISEYIFKLAIAWLVKLLMPVIKKLAKEKINQFKDLMISLTGLNKVADTIKSASDSINSG